MSAPNLPTGFQFMDKLTSAPSLPPLAAIVAEARQVEPVPNRHARTLRDLEAILAATPAGTPRAADLEHQIDAARLRLNADGLRPILACDRCGTTHGTLVLRSWNSPAVCTVCLKNGGPTQQ